MSAVLQESAERRFLRAKARHYYALAAAFKAEAQAARINPWTPASHNASQAEHAEAMAAHYLDCARETEEEASL